MLNEGSVGNNLASPELRGPVDLSTAHISPVNLPQTQLQYSRDRADSLYFERMHNWLTPTETSQVIREKLISLGMPTISEFATAPLPTSLNKQTCGWTFSSCLDYSTGEHHYVLAYGNVREGSLGNGENVLVRLHSASKLDDIFFGINGISSAKFDSAMLRIMQEGRGVIVYLQQDGRSHGVENALAALNQRYQFNSRGEIVEREDPHFAGKKISLPRSFELVGGSPDNRDYTAATQILEKLGIRSIRLLNGDITKYQAIADAGIEVVAVESLMSDAIHEGFFNLKARSQAKHGSMNLQENREALRAEMEAHCARLESDHRMPWETVRRNKELLMKHDYPIVERLGVAPAPTQYGAWSMVVYGDITTGEVHRALVYGNALEKSFNLSEEALVRLHSSCATNEIFNSTNCECKEELRIAMENIRDAGGGAILYLEQEGRGTGIEGKMAQLAEMFEFDGNRAIPRVDPETGRTVQTVDAYKRRNYPPEIRDFSVATEILRDLKASSVTLMTNNPRKIEGIQSAGFRVTPQSIIADIDNLPDSDTLRRELEDKKIYLGHIIPDSVLANR